MYRIELDVPNHGLRLINVRTRAEAEAHARAIEFMWEMGRNLSSSYYVIGDPAAGVAHRIRHYLERPEEFTTRWVKWVRQRGRQIEFPGPPKQSERKPDDTDDISRRVAPND